eukprot:1157810-Pelagomonas_calceolata.AAC.5
MEEAPEVPTQVWEDYALHLEILEHQLKLDTGLPLLIDVARGTQYLHEHFIIHGDLKAKVATREEAVRMICWKEVEGTTEGGQLAYMSEMLLVFLSHNLPFKPLAPCFIPQNQGVWRRSKVVHVAPLRLFFGKRHCVRACPTACQFYTFILRHLKAQHAQHKALTLVRNTGALLSSHFFKLFLIASKLEHDVKRIEQKTFTC